MINENQKRLALVSGEMHGEFAYDAGKSGAHQSSVQGRLRQTTWQIFRLLILLQMLNRRYWKNIQSTSEEYTLLLEGVEQLSKDSLQKWTPTNH